MGDWERGGTVGPPAEHSHPPAQDSHESPFCTGCTGHASAQPGSAPQDQTRAHITVPLLPQRLRTASNRRASRRDAGRLVPLWSVPAALRPSGRLGWRLVGGVAWAVCLTPVGRTCKQTAPSDDRHSTRPERETCTVEQVRMCSDSPSATRSHRPVLRSDVSLSTTAAPLDWVRGCGSVAD
jgi:hypothetical protein